MTVTTVQDVLETPKPYHIDEQRLRIVHMLAKPGHKPCSGSGIIGWRNGGRVAILCICVRKRAALLEPKLEEAQAKLREHIAHEKRWDVRIRKAASKVVQAALGWLKKRLYARKAKLLAEQALASKDGTP